MAKQAEQAKKAQKLQAPKGVPDYLPPDSARFVATKRILGEAAELAGYRPAELPIFEDTALYVRGVGESTDIVGKEMYTFPDQGGRSLTLRPEWTAGVVRAVVEHGLDRGPLPVKLWYAGPCFRYERPQSGRYRQFQQMGVEAIGVDDPALDAEVVAVADEGLRRLGLQGYRLEINSLGDETCRPEYRERLLSFLRGLDLDEATRQRAERNPLRVLDDKRPEVKAQLVDAPLLVDYLSDTAKEHFETVLAHLRGLGVEYTLSPKLVRGLDYYTKTTFEFVHSGLGAQSAIGGGGHYDGLVADLGGQALPGVGFSIGLERTLLALAAEEVPAQDSGSVPVFGVALGSEAKERMARLAGELRKAGIGVDLAYGDRALKAAMRAADRSGARFVLIVGEAELASEHAQLKDMGSGEQSSVPLPDVVAELALRLADISGAA
ncbi:MAG: histidine--tRNA ligase [Segniliparus sp.]|uniref:histidine--tRNA ligase n=1 Tax=Segniliparus sp. TaxID=2804064 RepID=UPI003F31F136